MPESHHCTGILPDAAFGRSPDSHPTRTQLALIPSAAFAAQWGSSAAHARAGPAGPALHRSCSPWVPAPAGAPSSRVRTEPTLSRACRTLGRRVRLGQSLAGPGEGTYRGTLSPLCDPGHLPGPIRHSRSAAFPTFLPRELDRIRAPAGGSCTDPRAGTGQDQGSAGPVKAGARITMNQHPRSRGPRSRSRAGLGWRLYKIISTSVSPESLPVRP